MLRESFECYQISREGLEDPELKFFVLTLVCYLTDDSLIFLTIFGKSMSIFSTPLSNSLLPSRKVRSQAFLLTFLFTPFINKD